MVNFREEQPPHGDYRSFLYAISMGVKYIGAVKINFSGTFLRTKGDSEWLLKTIGELQIRLETREKGEGWLRTICEHKGVDTLYTFHDDKFPEQGTLEAITQELQRRLGLNRGDSIGGTL